MSTLKCVLKKSYSNSWESVGEILFKHDKKRSKVQATVSASLVTPDRDYRKQILEKSIYLTKEGKEKTVLRFKLDNNFKLVSGSVNSLRKSLIGGL